MAIKTYNPTTPARRGMTTQDLSDVTTRKPLKSLLKSKKQNAGRNNTGRITVRHRGGGVRYCVAFLDLGLQRCQQIGVAVGLSDTCIATDFRTFRNLVARRAGIGRRRGLTQRLGRR